MNNFKKIACVAVDDEPPALEILEKYILSIPGLELCALCSNALKAFEVLQSNKVDLLFIDIQMPQILGTNFIRALANPPKVIFTTAFRKYAVEGFDLDAVDYLLKPISFERFLKAINKVMKLNLPIEASGDSPILQENTQEDFICLRADRKNIKINFADILFIESLKDYIKVVTINKTIVSRHAISEIEEVLPKQLFLRIHRSYIISKNKINSFSQELVQLEKYELPISRSYRHEVEKILAVK